MSGKMDAAFKQLRFPDQTFCQFLAFAEPAYAAIQPREFNGRFSIMLKGVHGYSPR